MTRPDALSMTLPTAAPDAHGEPSARRRIRGLRLRELLVLILLRDATPMTVAALVAAVDAAGFRIDGRPDKVVSDQLRYELARGRVRRVARGVYVAGTVTRQARWRMQRRISALCTDHSATTIAMPVVTAPRSDSGQGAQTQASRA